MSKSSCVLPYYFPTTVVFIDDDESFLNNLSVCLPANLAARMVTQPQQALDHITEVNSGRPISEQCFRQPAATLTIGTNNQLTLPVSLSPITDALYTEQRFSEVSVVVVDYDMPSVNGLEVCRRLAPTGVKKILLTGKADEKAAVKAFNNGLIDCFVSKGNTAMMDQLISAIADLQQRYFATASSPLAGILGQADLAFLADAQFARSFEQMREQHGWVEYYLSPKPAGMLCLTADGQATQLLVADQQHQQISYQRATDMGAPADVLELIRSAEVIIDLNVDHDQAANKDFQWQQNIHLSQPVTVPTEWRIAMIAHPRGLKYNPEQLYNFRYYLEILHYIEHELKGA
jgi:CheY-like chemotaxis protein